MAYSLTEEFVWKEVGDQVVVLNLDSGVYYSLNPTGSRVWKGLMDQSSLDDIVGKLCDEYSVSEATARKDAEEMIDQFLAKKMLVRK